MKRLIHTLRTAIPVCFIGLAITGCLPSDGSDDYKLAMKYIKGDGVEKNIPKALDLMQTSADKNYIPALDLLGSFYETGNVHRIKQDPYKAVEYYKKAADKGDIYAENHLGVLYLNYEGKGIPNSLNKSAEYFRKSAEQGDPLGQMSLGLLYLDGNGVPKDYNLAEKWINKARAQGYARAEQAAQSLNEARNAPPPFSERGSFSAQTFAQQKALNEFESLKQDYPGNPTVGGSISQVSGSTLNYDSNLKCSAVVIKDFDPSKFNGVSKNINFFMDDGSQAIVILDSINHVKGVQINDQYTDAYGSCSIEYGHEIGCMIYSSNGSRVNGTYANVISIQALISYGASISR